MHPQYFTRGYNSPSKNICISFLTRPIFIRTYIAKLPAVIIISYMVTWWIIWVVFALVVSVTECFRDILRHFDGCNYATDSINLTLSVCCGASQASLMTIISITYKNTSYEC